MREVLLATPQNGIIGGKQALPLHSTTKTASPEKGTPSTVMPSV